MKVLLWLGAFHNNKRSTLEPCSLESKMSLTKDSILDSDSDYASDGKDYYADISSNDSDVNMLEQSFNEPKVKIEIAHMKAKNMLLTRMNRKNSSPSLTSSSCNESIFKQESSQLQHINM